MSSIVYYTNLSGSKNNSPLKKISQLLTKFNLKNLFKNSSLIALKIHFGEFGNTSFIRPIYLHPVIDELKKLGLKPFLTDTNTLYVGMRTNSVDHLHNAYLNGFNYSTLQIPVIIADGLRGENSVELKVNLPVLKKVKLAGDMVNSDGMIVLSHFKAHEISGFGGAIKNISMGCASRQGKLDMHSQTKPVVKQSLCIACGICASNCLFNAIEIKDKAIITSKCSGCARCIAICPKEAIKILWNESSENCQKKMAEYAYSLVKALKNRIIFFNFVISVSPACDCYPGNDLPISEDIGVLASLDPVALDKACYDIIVKRMGYDPFKKVYPEIDSMIHLKHGEEIGLGKMDYIIEQID